MPHLLRVTQVCAGLCLLLAGCLPVTTSSPVGSTAGLGADPALIGSWKVIAAKGTAAAEDPSEGPGFVHFLRGEDNRLTAVLIAAGSAAHKTRGDWSVYSISTATLGGRRYLNARAILESGKPAKAEDADGNIAMLYRLEADRLTIYLMDDDKAKAAIAAGEIEGRVSDGKFGDVTLTATPQALDAYITGAGAKLFTQKLMVLKKVE